MKTFIIIAIIALIAQVTLAGNVGRVKRSDEVEDAVRETFKMGRHIVDTMIDIVEHLLANLPDTEEHITIKKDCAQFLVVAYAIKSEEGNCVAKTIAALADMAVLFEKFENESSESSESSETKAFEELFDKFATEEFKKEFNEYYEKYYTKEFLQKIKNYNEEDMAKWSLFTEVC